MIDRLTHGSRREEVSGDEDGDESRTAKQSRRVNNRASCDGGVYYVHTAPNDRPASYLPLGKEGGQGGRGARLRGVDGTKPFVLPGLLPLCT